MTRYAALWTRTHRFDLVMLTKEAPTGKIIEEWKKALQASSKTVETFDVSVGFSALMGVKDENELVRSVIRICRRRAF